MLLRFYIAILGAVTVQSITSRLDRPTGEGKNGTGWEIGRVVIKEDGKEKTVCGEKVDNATLLVFCSLAGYMDEKQLVASQIKSYTWSSELEVGYSAKCSKWDSADSCAMTKTTDCKQPLVINCTTHYETVLGGGVSTNDLLLPVILIPICLLYVIVLCYLESEDTRKSKVARKQMLKANTVKAFAATSNSNLAKSDGAV